MRTIYKGTSKNYLYGEKKSMNFFNAWLIIYKSVLLMF